MTGQRSHPALCRFSKPPRSARWRFSCSGHRYVRRSRRCGRRSCSAGRHALRRRRHSPRQWHGSFRRVASWSVLFAVSCRSGSSWAHRLCFGGRPCASKVRHGASDDLCGPCPDRDAGGIGRTCSDVGSAASGPRPMQSGRGIAAALCKTETHCGPCPTAPPSGISSVTTEKSVSTFGPKVCVRGTSAASRPLATRIRAMRRVLLRGSKTHQRPSR